MMDRSTDKNTEKRREKKIKKRTGEDWWQHL